MFVYVMDDDSRRLLEARGFQLIKKDARNGLWCFENKNMETFEFSMDIPCVVSDVMTF